MADRGLCSYAHLALLVQAGVHAVLRVSARQIVDFTPGRAFVKPSVRRTPAVKGVPRSRWLKGLGVHDQLVAWLKPTTCPSWLTREALAALPDSLVLREVRYDVGTPGFRTRQITLVTTLLDAQLYRMADLAELYRQRWRVETSLAQLKTSMQMDVLHCKTVAGVLKELTVFALVYNLVRLVMCQSATLQHLSVERISFLDALRWLGAPNTGSTVSGLDRESYQTASGRAAGQEATPQALPADDHPPARTTSAVGPASARRLTSCHSRKTLHYLRMSPRVLRTTHKHRVLRTVCANRRSPRTKPRQNSR